MHRCRFCLPTLVFFLCVVVQHSCCHAWTWSDWIRGDAAFFFFSQQQQRQDTLDLEQVSEMRVRDIRRRLARSHGYSAEELGKMLDKKELMEALAFEEHKVRLQQREDLKRQLVLQAFIVTVVAGALVWMWPLVKHVWDVAHVHFVVYTDRKRLEARRCWELQSCRASVGVLLMFLVDVLQMWLTVSVILSWVTSSRYFFPVPALLIRPAAMMGGPVASGSLTRYGINVGPMVCAWGFRLLQGKLTTWTGRALSQAARAQAKKSRKDSRQDETREEKGARRAARRALKAAREKEQQQQQQQQQRDLSNETQSQGQANQGKQGPSEWVEPSPDEKRNAAAAAAEARCEVDPIVDSYTAMDELD